MNNKIITIFLAIGALIVLVFGIDIIRNRSNQEKEFDFSGITRPILYEQSPRTGPSSAKITIYEYADFNCPSCKAQSADLNRAIEKYKSSVRLVWKDFPFLSASSKQAAIAARCAKAQEKFWEYHDWLFNNQNILSDAAFESGAQLFGLNTLAFTQCLQDDTIENLVEQDFREGQALGIDSTPTIVIGDVGLVGVSSYQDLEAAIINELSK
ncbi:MAG: hypothetical protein COV79_00890 [Parcubacteria group bacterium CG11_big_fil_rev_8_21_14_0_20_41_14]|nr:MAG: hypothetical protein COW93_00970 [Parcubacteria group bacterium CG22_combo_CG10-13_8_21_14_all_41_9]PIQ80360.1 MAG: hypothetical protein COV79_00890 [Parcubacteria group bacterium CG11_big_fil_rev_8_21_14_0_20_41_14]